MRKYGRAAAVGAFFFLAATRALAANLSVGCPGAPAGTYDFTSLRDAIASIPSTSISTDMALSGTCTEQVEVLEVRGLRIVGAPGAAVVGPAGSDFTFQVRNSSTIALRNLIVDGASSSVVALNVSHAQVDLQNCTLQHGPIGLRVVGNSSVHAVSTFVQDNTDTGVDASEASVVSFDNTESVEPVPSAIRRNQLGVHVDNAHVALWGGTSVTDNGFAGVQVEGGKVATCCNPGTRVIANNGLF